MALSPVSSLPSQFENLYIQGVTKVKAMVSATGQYGAEIRDYSAKVDGVSYDSSADYTSSYLAQSGRKMVLGYATDSRGFTGENQQEIDVIAYSTPKLESTSAVRCDEDGNESDSGTYLKITARRSYSLVMSNGEQKNFCGIQYRYTQDGNSWSQWSTILDRHSFSSDSVTTAPLLDGSLSSELSYVVHVMAIDDVGRYAETYITVSTANVYWHRDGARNALGLGKYNERDNAVDSDWDFYMNGHKVTDLPEPTSDTDAVPKSYVDRFDVTMGKNLNAQGWYKLGTVSGNMCAVITVTTGGRYVNNDVSPSMVDIATQFYNARAFVRLPSLLDYQISKIGLIQETETVFGVYGYYNSASSNFVQISVRVHMGQFTSAELQATSVSESDMLAVVALKQ
jgi:hypothetical protein